MPLRSKKQVFDEFKKHDLHSGKGGPVVRSRAQAIAIALRVADESRPREAVHRAVKLARKAHGR